MENEKKQPEKDYEQLVKEITDRVWAMWQEELRQNRERRGKQVKIRR